MLENQKKVLRTNIFSLATGREIETYKRCNFMKKKFFFEKKTVVNENLLK